MIDRKYFPRPGEIRSFSPSEQTGRIWASLSIYDVRHPDCTGSDQNWAWLNAVGKNSGPLATRPSLKEAPSVVIPSNESNQNAHPTYTTNVHAEFEVRWPDLEISWTKISFHLELSFVLSLAGSINTRNAKRGQWR